MPVNALDKGGQLFITSQGHGQPVVFGTYTIRPQIGQQGCIYLCRSTNRTKLGERAVSSVGPTGWKKLPESIRTDNDKKSFKRNLKTHLFITAIELTVVLFFNWSSQYFMCKPRLDSNVNYKSGYVNV